MISNALEWVRLVQIRALQDFGVKHPEEFEQAWMTLQYSKWIEVSHQWAKILRSREERDLGWVPSDTLSSSSGVVVLRNNVQNSVRDIGFTIGVEDRQRWESYVQKQSPSTSTPVANVDRILHKNEVIEHVKSASDGGDALEGTANASFHSRDTNTLKVHNSGVKAGVDIDPYGFDSPPTGTLVVCSTLGDSEDKVRQCAPLFSEIPMVSPNQNACVTVTQVIQSMDGLEDIPREESESQFRVSQYLNAPNLLEEKTPIRGMSVMFPNPLQGSTLHCVPDSVLENSNSRFEQEKDTDMDAPKDLLDVEVQTHCVTNASFDATSPLWQVLDASPLIVSSLSEVYERLEIEKLLKAIPSQGSGIIAKPVTVFYNQFQKEIEVNHKDIRELRKANTCLGNDVMDFVLSRLYLTYAECYRQNIHIVSSYISGSVMAIMKSGCGLEKLAKDFLHPPPGVQVDQVEDLIVPWVSDGHWSVLVFQPHRILHLDSCKGMVHKPQTKHFEFLRLVCAAWQQLRGVQEYVVDDIQSVDVFQQVGSDECGHLCIHNIMLYLKVTKFLFPFPKLFLSCSSLLLCNSQCSLWVEDIES